MIGVAPASFTGMHLVLHPVYYVTLATAATLAGQPPGLLDQRGARMLLVKGRLKPGVSIEQAHQEANIIAAELERTYPDTNRAFGFLVRSDFQARIEERGPSAPGAFMLMTLAVVVLLVACANVAGLLISRAPARMRELGVRMAIGGGRVRVMRQLLTEGLLIAAGGAAVGIGTGYAVLRLMQSGGVVSDIGVRMDPSLDRRALMVGLAAAIFSVIASSLLPAWQSTRSKDLTSSLRPGSSSSTNRARRLWGRHGLVIGQVALSLMMLIVATFVYRAFAAEFARPGFDTTRMVLVGLNPVLAGYDAAQTDTLLQRLTDAARALPGVRSVGLTSIVPLNQDNREALSIVPDGYELPPGTDTITVSSTRIDEGYLETIRIPLVRGRPFRETDTADTPAVVVVNQTLAARYWPGQDPIGKRMRLQGADGPWAQVVGVAADSKYNWVGEAPTPFVYLSAPAAGHATRHAARRHHGTVHGSRGRAARGAARAGPESPHVARAHDGGVLPGQRRQFRGQRDPHGGLDGHDGAGPRARRPLQPDGVRRGPAHAGNRHPHGDRGAARIGAAHGAGPRRLAGAGRRGRSAWPAASPLAGCCAASCPAAAASTSRPTPSWCPTLVAITLAAAYVPARRASRIDPLVALRQE